MRYERHLQRSLLWLLCFFMKHPTAAALNAHISHIYSSSYCEAANNLFDRYTIDDVITETGADMMGFIQLSNRSPTEYAEVLWSKALQCIRVYDEYVLKGSFTGALPESVHHNMRSYLSSKKSTTIHDLAHHMMSLTKVQRGLHNANRMHNNDSPDSRRRNGVGKRGNVTSVEAS